MLNTRLLALFLCVEVLYVGPSTTCPRPSNTLSQPLVKDPLDGNACFLFVILIYLFRLKK